MATQIKVAAQWWADRLVNCRNSGLSAEERRDPANADYQFGEMLMQVTRPQITPEQAETFRAALSKALETASKWTRQCIGVDYGADQILSDALEAAGIPERTGTLPIKTVMWLNDDGSVRVRYGYGAEIQELRPAPEGKQP